MPVALGQRIPGSQVVLCRYVTIGTTDCTVLTPASKGLYAHVIESEPFGKSPD